jgi:uncharacterized membrane protein YqiK
MSGSAVGWIVGGLIVLAIVIVVLVYLVNWLYRRSTKENAFVRTGWGGEKVVKDGGAFVLPIVHEIIPVNMNTLRLEIRRGRESALITKNRMRVDVVAEFYVRVEPSQDSISAAAQTLGRRTIDPDALRELVEGKFVDALRASAAEMTMEELHEKRSDYVQRVRSKVAEDLLRNGLELEAVSLTGMDQTNMDFFNPSNAFDAEGLTRLTEEIERRKKVRNDIEQDTMIQIRNKNLEAEKIALEIDRESEQARLQQQADIEARRAAQQSEITRERAAREREAEEAQIASQLEISRARILQERTLEEERIAREREVQKLEVARRQALDHAEILARDETERERIKVERGLEEERIGREGDTERFEIERKRATEIAEQERAIAIAEKNREKVAAEAETEQAAIGARLAVERAKIERDGKLELARIARERETQSLEVSRRQSLEEAEISAQEDIERARIATDRALEEARIVRDRDLRRLEVERRLALEMVELERSIQIALKSKEQSEALTESEAARAKAIAAEERAFSARELEIAERRKDVELILARQEAEREGLRAKLTAAAEKAAAADRAEALRLAAEGEAEAEKIRVIAAKLRYEIEAEGRRQMNEASNVLSTDSRKSEMRLRLIDKLEAIIRESVKPMEKIDGIKILQVDGLTGGGSHGNGAVEGNGSLPDSVVNSALRYRAQAPLIDSLLKEIGIGGGLNAVGQVLSDEESPTEPEAELSEEDA